MKHVIFRLTRSPLFWALASVNLVFVLLFSVRFRDNARDLPIYWDAYIEEYANMDELRAQKEVVLKLRESIETETPSYYDRDQLEYQKECMDNALTVMDFLLENESPWGEYVDGTTYAAEAYERRSYHGYMWEKCLVWQCFSAVILLCLIVNTAHSNGTYASEIVLYGRKKVFGDQAKAYWGTATLLFVLQFFLALLIGTRFPQIGEKYLYYYRGDFWTFSPALIRIMEWVGLYVILWMLWGALYLVSEMIPKVLPFLLTGAAITYCISRIFSSAGMELYRLFFRIWPENYWDGMPLLQIIALYLLRIILGIALALLTYRLVKKRRVKLRYE
ncbi:MAG: hypothetical protein IK125_02475 [Lachnospiraceae bacterium]|nr:hypothetical protein [Lachnospiraceae bacterium]